MTESAQATSGVPPGANMGVEQDAAFDQAYRAMKADPTLQFQFDAMPQPAEPRGLPEWLIKLIEAIAPMMANVFYACIAILVAYLLFVIIREILRRLPARTRANEAPTIEAPAPVFHPQQARARALLEEADKLAALGRFSEAVRIILHRSIEDIERTFPGAVGIAMTSREIAVIKPLSERGRSVFSEIARAVEVSLFGGAPLDAAQFAACRSAYESFALKGGPA